MFEKLLQLGPTFAFQVVLTTKKPRKTWLLNGYNYIYQVGMCCFYQIRVCDNLFPRRCTRPSLQCQLPFVPLAFKLSKNKKTQKNKREKFGSCFTVFSSSSNDPIHLGLQSYLFLINLIMPSLRVRHTWPGSTPPKNGNKGRRFGLFSVANLLLVFGRE